MIFIIINIKNKDILNNKEYIINNIFNFTDKQDVQRLENIINLLKNNKWDRKTLIMTNNKNLNYIMYNGDNFVFTNVSN